MAFTKNWDESVPPDTGETPSLGAQRIREFKQAIRERLAEDHKFVSDETGQSDIGKHKKVRLIKQDSDILAETDIGILYTKNVNNIPELFWRDENGNIKQLTSEGKLNIAEAEIPAVFVKLTGDQTIAGVKTFSSNPKIETYADPTADEEFAPKKYVDDAVSPLLSRTPDYDSGWFAVTANTLYTKAHSLSARPKLIVVLYDKESDGSGKNFIVGQMNITNYGDAGAIVGFDATNVYVRCHSYVSPAHVNDVDASYSELATSGYYRILAWK